jgi:hypothetical protein
MAFAGWHAQAVFEALNGEVLFKKRYVLVLA